MFASPYHWTVFLLRPVLASACSVIMPPIDQPWIAGLGVQFRHEVANERDCVFKYFATKVWHVRELVLEQQFHHVNVTTDIPPLRMVANISKG